MKNVPGTSKRRLRHQGGFTLVELLVVVGIIVALAAVVVPQVVQFSDRGDEGASAAEWDAIQRSIEALMSDQELSTVSAGASAAFITNSIDFDPGSGVQNLTNYMRDTTTGYCYTWDNTGSLLTQVEATGDPAACP
ncbi:MAG: prepilin-type N-terminal cleavage/methylation domain-containing protein [Chloroflexi bacterium]|nr:prepilin-type N-terminal cleavage/methylation domain-containing protein [Chloroflexota bacterium]